MNETSIALLIARLLRGDASALEPLYRRESGPVYRYALAMSGNPDWAADAMQDAFVALASRPEGFDPSRGSLGAYLAGMARHSLLARWREAPVAEDEEEALDDEAVLPPEMRLVQAQEWGELQRALQALPWPQREALVLVDLQDHSYADAARIAGIEPNTLRTRLHRARGKLAAALQPARSGVPSR